MSVVDEYLSKIEQPQKDALEHVRAVIKGAVPDGEEVITYGMPGFKYGGKYLIAYAAFKDHMSVFPGAAPVASMQERLSAFKQSKGTIQFTPENPLPDELLTEMVKLRMAEISNNIK